MLDFGRECRDTAVTSVAGLSGGNRIVISAAIRHAWWAARFHALRSVNAAAPGMHDEMQLPRPDRRQLARLLDQRCDHASGNSRDWTAARVTDPRDSYERRR